MTENDLIKLSMRQRDRIVEMLSKLYGDAEISMSDFGRIVIERGNKIMQVHWFEACFTIIPILMSKSRGDWQYYCNWIVTKMTSKKEINPIDYLYEKFQELNLESSNENNSIPTPCTGHAKETGGIE